MGKLAKNAMINEIRNRLGDHRDLLVVDCNAVDAITANEWRLALREKDISVFSVKNSLARRALHDLGVTSLDPILEGPSALVWGGEDIVSLSKEITGWAKKLEKLEVKGGTLENTTLTASDVTKLSKSPGRLELIAQIAGQVLSPGANLAGALLGPGSTIAGQLKTMSEEDE